jgi:hypothetical protein
MSTVLCPGKVRNSELRGAGAAEVIAPVCERDFTGV